jgi:hypothetical protein
MQHPDEGTIHAWIDGELSQDESSTLEAHLAECPECSASAAEARGLAAASSRIVSALDIVPGGVIPAAPARRRPWYASTQLRAAAAIAIVASASMLVLRDRTETVMDGALSVTAPAPASVPAAEEAPPAVEADNQEPQRQKSAAPSANVPVDAAQGLRKEKVEAAPRRRTEQQSAAGKPEALLPPPPVAAMSAPVARATADEASAATTGNAVSDSARRKFSARDAVVTTGVAESSLALKELRSDSATGVRRTFYEISPGVEVTLTDNPPVQPAPQMRRAVASAATPRAALKAEAVNSISWRDKRGHTMTLSGPVSKEQLESIRRQLPEDKR